MLLTNFQYDNTLLFNTKLFNILMYINSVTLVTLAINMDFGLVGYHIVVGVHHPGSIGGGVNCAFLHDLAIWTPFWPLEGPLCASGPNFPMMTKGLAAWKFSDRNLKLAIDEFDSLPFFENEERKTVTISVLR